MKTLNEKVQYALHASFLFLASMLLRDHGRRIVFVTTVYVHMTRITSFSRDFLDHLNEAMALAKTGSALEAPARLHEYIWDGETLDETIGQICGKDGLQCKALGPIEIAKVCDAVVDATPNWLRYGRRDDMLRDVRKLFFTAREEAGVPAHA